LKDPSKPMILAISRPDPRKNISALVNAYGKSQELQKAANLVIIAGSRDVISEAEKSSRDVLTDLLLLIDKYDLYGRVAYPKSHEPQEIPMLFRLAMKSRGVFINPALTEPFGLTLIEAAASGLPVVATEDGGPKEIIRHCKNGILIDPLNEKKMASALQKILSNKEKWNKYSESGIQGANNHFSWEAHTERYITVIDQLKNKYKKRIRITSTSKTPLISADRMIICDIDNTLLGDKKSLKELIDSIQASNKDISFGVATGRRVESALAVLKEWKVPVPDVIISSVGSEIHYSEGLFQDMAWAKHIDHRWKPDSVKEILESVPGLKLQPSIDQRKHKISYFMDPVKTPDITEIMSLLRQNRLHVNLIFSHDEFLDILPIRASKGLAVRYFAIKWGIPFERILVAGDSGNDEEMLRGNTLAVVVGNYSHELESLREDPHIFFAENKYAGGILEGIRHYDFLGRIHAPV
ncbi:MAG: HAD-IIB family hydrolase, partial [Spirochaetota bacterium]|nr:HAD-IIB family hydrolase [Spirochaetota bacterium]